MEPNMALVCLLVYAGPGSCNHVVTVGSGLAPGALVASTSALIADAELARRGDELLVARKSTRPPIVDPGASRKVTLLRKVPARGLKVLKRLRIFRRR